MAKRVAQEVGCRVGAQVGYAPGAAAFASRNFPPFPSSILLFFGLYPFVLLSIIVLIFDRTNTQLLICCLGSIIFTKPRNLVLGMKGASGGIDLAVVLILVGVRSLLVEGEGGMRGKIFFLWVFFII